MKGDKWFFKDKIRVCYGKTSYGQQILAVSIGRIQTLNKEIVLIPFDVIVIAVELIFVYFNVRIKIPKFLQR